MTRPGNSRQSTIAAYFDCRLLQQIVIPGILLLLPLVLSGCYLSNTEPRDSSSIRSLSGSETVATGKPDTPQLKVEQRGKQLVFSWLKKSGVDYYNLLESPDGGSRFEKIAENIDTFSHTIEITPRPQGWTRARYHLEACNRYGCSQSPELGVEDILNPGAGYTRAGNADLYDYFGSAVALSSNGKTVVAGAPGEDSNAQGANGNPGDDSLERAGAAYIFSYNELLGRWEQHAYLKATPSSELAMFGYSVAISGDGTVVAVGAPRENDSYGAVYIFTLENGQWRPAGSLSLSGNSMQPQFGFSVALNRDGTALAVGAPDMDEPGAGNSLRSAGAVYLYSRETSGWQPAGRLTPDQPMRSARFGTVLALSTDGSLLAAGAEGWNTSGAAFVFSRNQTGGSWSQQAVITPPEEAAQIHFGASLALSGDGSTLAIGAYRENSAATGSDQTGETVAEHSGATYVYSRDQGNWQTKHKLKPSNTGAHNEFGTSLALNNDGTLLAVGAPFEDSKSVDLDGDADNRSGPNSGAAYLYSISAQQGQQIAYIKPIGDNALINERFYGEFGTALSISTDGSTLAIGAPHGVSVILPQRGESSDALNATSGTGITYLYSLPVILK